MKKEGDRLIKINVRKVIRNGLYLLMLTLLTGCGKKQVDYSGGSAADTILGEELAIPDSYKTDMEHH